MTGNKNILRILSFAFVFKNTAIILNTTANAKPSLCYSLSFTNNLK